MMGDDGLSNANGTQAKDIALYFNSRCNIRATPSIYGKTINQAKTLLESGYSVEEIKTVIDYLVEIEKVDLFSLGYVNSSIASVYKKAMKQTHLKIAQEIVSEQDKLVSREELGFDESSERNRKKIGTIGSKSRFGEKFNIDMPTK